jgi:hypothetical protein
VKSEATSAGQSIQPYIVTQRPQLGNWEQAIAPEADFMKAGQQLDKKFRCRAWDVTQ